MCTPTRPNVISAECNDRGPCREPGYCSCLVGFGGPTCDRLLGPDGERLRIQPERHRAKIHFVFGIKAKPRRGLIDGIPTGADLDTAQQAVLLDSLSQELIAALCERLELAPPYHVLPGTIKCPLLTLKRARLAAAATWPVPADDVLPLLRSLGLSAEASQLVGVRKDAITERQFIHWLAVSAHTNVPSGGVGEGSTAALRAESEWFEGVALTANEKAAAEGSILRGWQTSSAYVMMEAFDEVVSGTAGCVISGALLTAATLLILTGSLSLTLSTLLGVVVVLICFIGYLVERGYELGVIEAIATTIFIGFACDYCVHIGQVYRTSHGNFTRMLEHCGPSLWGAALTTAGAAAPLMLCQIILFQQMGEFICVCTGLSLVVAITFIAPLVEICTPRRTGEGGEGGEGDISPSGGESVPEVRRSFHRVGAVTHDAVYPIIPVLNLRRGAPEASAEDSDEDSDEDHYGSPFTPKAAMIVTHARTSFVQSRQLNSTYL